MVLRWSLLLGLLLLFVSVNACGGDTVTPPVDEDPSPTPDGYNYTISAPLGDTETEVNLDGMRVTIPAVHDDPSSTVDVAISDMPLGGVGVSLSGLSPVVALRFSGSPEFVGSEDGLAPLLRLQLVPTASGLATQASAEEGDLASIAMMWSRVDDGAWQVRMAQARWDELVNAFSVVVAYPQQVCMSADEQLAAESCELAWQIVDATPLVLAEDALESTVLSASSTSPIPDAKNALGLHQVDVQAFAAAGGTCDAAMAASFTHESERPSFFSPFDRNARTAIVFVHGWQSFVGMLKQLDGDVPEAMPAHCDNWESFFAGLGAAGGPWAAARQNVDVFTYRYNSNLRVGANGERFAGSLYRLLLGETYDRIVLVGHSMGGLVIHDARQRVLQDDRYEFKHSDLPVITLATPYMGGPMLCTSVRDGLCQDADTTLLTLYWGFIPVSGMASTLDLSTALRISGWQLGQMGYVSALLRPYEQNPYLLQLWENVNMTDGFLTAFVGSSLSLPFYSGIMYSYSAIGLSVGWGANDGIVPMASGRASVDLGLVNPTPRIANIVEYGRDHGFMNKGCEGPLCPVGPWFRDPYLDAVVEEISRVTLPAFARIVSATPLSPPGTRLRPGEELLIEVAISSEFAVVEVEAYVFIEGGGRFSTQVTVTPPGESVTIRYGAASVATTDERVIDGVAVVAWPGGPVASSFPSWALVDVDYILAPEPVDLWLGRWTASVNSSLDPDVTSTVNLRIDSINTGARRGTSSIRSRSSDGTTDFTLFANVGIDSVSATTMRGTVTCTGVSGTLHSAPVSSCSDLFLWTSSPFEASLKSGVEASFTVRDLANEDAAYEAVPLTKRW